MNRPLKRILAFAGSVVLGTLGAVALGSPAQAHHNNITAGAVCANGKIKITWTVANSERDYTEEIKWMSQDPGDTIDGISVGTVLGKRQTPTGIITGTQFVDAGTQSATLQLEATWSSGYSNFNNANPADTHTIPLRNLDCEGGFTGAVTGSAECITETGTWNVTWQVSNEHSNRQATAQVVTNGPPNERTATSTGGVWTTLPDENLITGLADGNTINAASTKVAHQTVPGTADAARLKVQLTWTRNNIATQQHSATATVNFTGTCVKDAPKPGVLFASDCTGVVKVTLVNFAGATKEAVFVVAGAGGWTSGEVVVPKPTGTKDETAVVTVPAANSASVVVRDSGELSERYSWQDSTNCHPVDIKIKHTCAGIEVELDNPLKGTAHTIKLVPTSGDTVTKTIQPGEKATFKFPAPNDTDAFKVDMTIGDGAQSTITWERPEDCEGFNATVEETCTGAIITLTNPQDSTPIAVVLTPTPGEPVSYTLNPGQTRTDEFLAGPNGLTINGSINGEANSEPFVWTKPEDCPPPQLPKTGDNTVGYIASGTGLVALGAVVFFLARRRMMHLRRLAS